MWIGIRIYLSEFHISSSHRILPSVFTSTSGRRCSRCSSNSFSSWRKEGSRSTVTVCDKNMATKSKPKHLDCNIWKSFDFCTSLQTKGPLLELCSSLLERSMRQHHMLRTLRAHVVDQQAGGTYWQAGRATFASTVKAWQLSQCLGWTGRDLKNDGTRNASP